VRAGWRDGAPIIVSSSRAILYAGSGDDHAAAARRVALVTRATLNEARGT
jgi:orotidine-5'-phosphate decarboxylase